MTAVIAESAESGVDATFVKSPSTRTPPFTGSSRTESGRG
jgi:hypothetical protein